MSRHRLSLSEETASDRTTTILVVDGRDTPLATEFIPKRHGKDEVVQKQKLGDCVY